LFIPWLGILHSVRKRKEVIDHVHLASQLHRNQDDMGMERRKSQRRGEDRSGYRCRCRRNAQCPKQAPVEA
jgi:hypothetical protein